MRKIQFLLLLAITSLILLGCSSPPTNDRTVAHHAWINNSFSQVANFYDMELDSFEILRRRTSTENRIDTVDVSLTSSHSDFEFMGNVTVTYRLYDDGWHLYSVRTNRITVIPKYDFRGYWTVDSSQIDVVPIPSLNVLDVNWKEDTITTAARYSLEPRNFVLSTYGGENGLISWSLGTSALVYSEHGFEVYTADVIRIAWRRISIDYIRESPHFFQLFRSDF